MPDVITLAEAKAHLSITSDLRDADLNDKLTAATQNVIDWLTRRDTAWNDAMEAWTAETIPKSVRHAIIVRFGELTRERGDDPPSQSVADGSPSPTVRALLARYFEPGVA